MKEDSSAAAACIQGSRTSDRGIQCDWMLQLPAALTSVHDGMLH